MVFSDRGFATLPRPLPHRGRYVRAFEIDIDEGFRYIFIYAITYLRDAVLLVSFNSSLPREHLSAELHFFLYLYFALTRGIAMAAAPPPRATLICAHDAMHTRNLCRWWRSFKVFHRKRIFEIFRQRELLAYRRHEFHFTDATSTAAKKFAQPSCPSTKCTYYEISSRMIITQIRLFDCLPIWCKICLRFDDFIYFASRKRFLPLLLLAMDIITNYCITCFHGRSISRLAIRAWLRKAIRRNGRQAYALRQDDYLMLL